MNFLKKEIYLDYASATPVRKEIQKAMEKYFSTEFANPSAIYDAGRAARAALESARLTVARAMHAGTKDVVFTSGGTESDNMAIFGVFEKAKEIIPHPHIIVTEHDHPAILEAACEAERRGAELSVVPVEEVIAHIKENTVLVSLSLCNSETGEIYPVGRIGRAVKEARKKQETGYPLMHIDASQAAATQAINVDTLGADLLTLDAGKIYGPKGVGALIVRPQAKIYPLLAGGGQERGLRSGTENVPGIVGFAEALRIIDSEREKNVKKMRKLREIFVSLLQREAPEAVINGGETVPNIISITIPGKLHEYLAIALAEKGICISTGSSCSSSKNEADKEALRFSFGIDTSDKNIMRAIRALKEVLI